MRLTNVGVAYKSETLSVISYRSLKPGVTIFASLLNLLSELVYHRCHIVWLSTSLLPPFLSDTNLSIFDLDFDFGSIRLSYYLTDLCKKWWEEYLISTAGLFWKRGAARSRERNIRVQTAKFRFSLSIDLPKKTEIQVQTSKVYRSSPKTYLTICKYNTYTNYTQYEIA